jgi:hypothetical protein
MQLKFGMHIGRGDGWCDRRTEGEIEKGKGGHYGEFDLGGYAVFEAGDGGLASLAELEGGQ